VNLGDFVTVLVELLCIFTCSSNVGNSEVVTLKFKDIVVQLQKKDILKKVYGMARPGQPLAIMGPSGKTCILDCFVLICFPRGSVYMESYLDS